MELYSKKELYGKEFEFLHIWEIRCLNHFFGDWTTHPEKPLWKDGPNVILTAGLGMIFNTRFNVICTTGLNINFTADRNVILRQPKCDCYFQKN